MFVFRPKSNGEPPPAAAIMPVDFFQVKREKPRGDFNTMGMFTLAILFITLPMFIYLAVDGSRNTTIVSEVSGEDLTGIDGWETCTMISKVNDEYALDANTTYTLVNVMESKTECAAALAAASPCSSDDIQYNFDGSYVSWGEYAPYGLTVIDQSGNFWALDNSEYPTLYMYSPSTGTIAFESKGSTSLPGSPQEGGSIVDMDSSGRVVSIYNITGIEFGLRYYDPSSGIETLVALSVEPGAIAVDSSDNVWFTSASEVKQALNCIPADSEFQIFKYDSSTNSESPVAIYPGGNATSLNLLSIGPTGDLWGVSAEITSDNCDPSSGDSSNTYLLSIFTLDTSSGTTISTVKDITSYVSLPSMVQGFTVDVNGIAWVMVGIMSSNTGYSSTKFVKYDTVSGDISWGPFDSSIYPSYIGAPRQLVLDSTGNIYFMGPSYSTGPDASFYKYDVTVGTFEYLMSYSRGYYSWFVCKDVVQTLIPSSSALMIAACPLNGILWNDAVNVPPKFFFTYAEMEPYVIDYVVDNRCDAHLFYSEVCGTVGELPPYVCTKKNKEAASKYLGVAAANAEILYAALVFLCGLMLDMYKGRMAKKRDGNDDNEKDLETGVVSEHGLELTISGVTSQQMNPGIAAAFNKYDKKIAALEKKVADLEGEQKMATLGVSF